ncbi:MAG: excinuclease ABC subunit UvrC [Microcoleaceae cyanobacterium]
MNQATNTGAASSQLLPLIRDSERLESRLKEIPSTPGVYLMRDKTDNILYIGKSKKLRSRVRSYFRDRHWHSPRIAMMVQQVVEIEFIVTDTEAEALALEDNLIKQHYPHFNVLLKDDKKYPYLCITWSEKYPRIFITRRRSLNHRTDRYYGPYVDVGRLRSTLGLVKRVFPLRQRPKPLFKNRPCLNYDIGRCPGVCQELISPEDYHKVVQKVAMIFQGRTGELIEILTQQMETAAENLNFETAARARDQIKALQSIGTDQKVSLPDDRVSRDAIALAANEKQACVQLFQIRAGKLVGRLGFVVDVSNFQFSQPHISGENQTETNDISTAQEFEPQPEKFLEFGVILQRVLEDHYQTVDSVEIPPEILVQYELPEESILANWLSEYKGRKVTIVNPQRQTKADLVEMVERNAQYELERVQKFSDRNTQAMQDLAEILDLPDLPHRIEGYDISHIQGSDAVASRVVFIDGLPAKQHYRHYKIKNPEVRSGHSDDFASLAEVIQRRFRDYTALDEAKLGSDRPDLVMIDGGKGQLSAVVEVLRKLDLLEELNVVSLAKQREEIFLPGESTPLATDAEQPGVQLLRRLRDEAHRFAISFHREKRTERMRRSRLDEIPGLGYTRQKQLLAHFRSVDYIRMATVEQLAEVEGIGPKLAQQIYDYLHP